MGYFKMNLNRAGAARQREDSLNGGARHVIAPVVRWRARFAVALSSFLGATLAFGGSGSPNTSNGYNLPVGVTDMSKAIYGLHMEVFLICVGIAVVVFGVMIYSMVTFRQSKGAIPDTTMVHSTKVEVIWTIIPVLILVVMAVPAADLILKQEDMRNSELSIRVTGYQWKWQYQYMDAGAGVDFFSTLKQDSNFARQLNSGIDPKSVPNYLLDVDRPLVIPSGTKVRLLLTSMDVIHAWWVPDFGAKRTVLPGFVNEVWFKVDPGKEGIYRGQCAALCGRDHAFMPVVVEVRTPDDFKKWVESQKAAAKQAAGAAGGGDLPPKTAQVLTEGTSPAPNSL